MNKVYKVVWSKVKNAYVVASEIAKSRTKAPKSGIISKALVLGVLVSLLSCEFVMPTYAVDPYNSVLSGNAGENKSLISRQTSDAGAENIIFNAVVGTSSDDGNGGGSGYYFRNANDGEISHNSVMGTLTGNMYTILVDNWYGDAFSHNVVNGNLNGQNSSFINNGGNANYNNFIGNVDGYQSSFASISGESSYNTVMGNVKGDGSGLFGSSNALFNTVIGNAGNTDANDYQGYLFRSSANNTSYNTVIGNGYDNASLVSASGNDFSKNVVIGNTSGSVSNLALNNNGNMSNNIIIGNYDGSGGGSLVYSASGNDVLNSIFVNNAVSDGDGSRNYGQKGSNSVSIGILEGQIGQDVGVSSNDSIGIGKNYYVSGTNGIAIGTDTISANGGVAIGSESVATEENTVSVGNETKQRRIVNVEAGINDTDAVNVSQLNDAIAGAGGSISYIGINSATGGANEDGSGAVGTDSIAIGKGASANDTNAIAIGVNATTTNSENAENSSIAIGVNAKAVSGEDAVSGQTSSIAIGRDANAINSTSIAFGSKSLAKGKMSIAMGFRTEADEIASVVIGSDAKSTNPYTVTIGDSASTSSAHAVAIGVNAQANGVGSIALGRYAQTGSLTNGQDISIAIGYGAKAIGDETNTSTGELSSVAIGRSATAKNGYSVSLGHNANAIGDSSTAVGRRANSKGSEAIAIGNFSAANNSYSVALGADSSASANDVVSIGHKTTDTNYDGENYTSDYFRRIVNMADGTDSHDGATVGQTIELVAGDNVTITPDTTETNAIGQKRYKISAASSGGGSEIHGFSVGISPSEGNYNNDGTSGDNNHSIAIGGGASAGNNHNVAIGYGAIASDNGHNVVMGTHAKSNGGSSVAIGLNATVEEGNNGSIHSVAIGTNAKSNGGSSVAIGLNATVEEGNNGSIHSVAIGTNAKAKNGDNIAIGEIAEVSGRYSIALGANTNAQGEHSVALGDTSTAVENFVISVGSSGLKRRIVNVQDGVYSTDAATVAQTSTLSTDNDSGISLTSTTNTNGSKNYNIGIVKNGSITPESNGLLVGAQVYYEVRPTSNGHYIKTSNSAAGNLATLDAAFYNETHVTQDGNYIRTSYPAAGNLTVLDAVIKNVSDRIDGIDIPAPYTAGNNISIENNTVSAVGLIKYDDDTKKTATLEGGSRGTKLTNLSAGTLSKTSTDAVIGNQLWTTNQNMIGMQTNITTNTNNIASLNTSVSNALESVTSISGLVDTVNTLKADKSLNNLDDAGRQVIATAAANAVQEYMAGNNKVVPNGVVMNNVVPDDWSSIDDELSLKADKDDVYSKSETDTMLDTKADVSYVDDQLSAKANADDVYVKDEVDTMLGAKADADSVYTKDEADALLDAKADKSELDAKADKADLEAKAEVDASNIDVDKWTEKLGTGAIEEGNTGLVNGGTVFEAMKNVGGNDMIKAGVDAIEIGSDAKYDGLDSVSIAKSDGRGRALRGVLVDPADETSAANVGYVNAVADGITAGVNQGFAKLDDKINKTGAGAAALANLHPIADDGDTKWNIAAGIGRYHGESAGAVGVFYKPSDRVSVNVSSTIGNSDTMFGAGVSVAIDKPVSSGLSKVAMANEIRNLKADNEQMKQEREQDKRENAAMAAEIAQLKAVVAELVKKE